MEEQGNPKAAIAEGVMEEAEQMDEKQQAYVGALMQMLHSPETGGDIVAMLKSLPPEEAIPKTALLVNGAFESDIKAAGQEVPLETKLIGGVYLVGDLMEIANASAAYDRELGEDDMPIFLELMMEEYIQTGLKDGSIDPVELQEAVEPLLTDEQAQLGQTAAQETGVPAKPGQHAAMEQYASQRVRGTKDQIAEEQAAKNRTGAMQGPQGAPPQQGGQ